MEGGNKRKMLDLVKGAFTNLSPIGKAVCMCVASIGALFAKFIGGWDKLAVLLVTLVVIDYITGVASAWVNKELNSHKGRQGIISKICIFLVIGIAVVIDDVLIASDIVVLGQGALRTSFILFYVSNELISVVENLTKLGVPMPEKIKEVLEQLKNKTK